eukprot:g75010.t1
MVDKNGNLKNKVISLGRPTAVRAKNSIAGALLDIDFDGYEQCLFPTFPVAFVLVRDVTIKMSFSTDLSQQDSSIMKQDVQSAGSVLGFSTARGATDTSAQQGSAVMADAHHLIIKIPGPQILAWIQRFVAKDKAKTIT